MHQKIEIKTWIKNSWSIEGTKRETKHSDNVERWTEGVEIEPGERANIPPIKIAKNPIRLQHPQGKLLERPRAIKNVKATCWKQSYPQKMLTFLQQFPPCWISWLQSISDRIDWESFPENCSFNSFGLQTWPS